jgi:hypothetical protein
MCLIMSWIAHYFCTWSGVASCYVITQNDCSEHLWWKAELQNDCSEHLWWKALLLWYVTFPRKQFVSGACQILIILFRLEHYSFIVRFEAFTAVTTKNVVFWDVALCRSCINWCSGGTYRLHLQGRRICEREAIVSRWLQLLNVLFVCWFLNSGFVKFPLDATKKWIQLWKARMFSINIYAPQKANCQTLNWYYSRATVHYKACQTNQQLQLCFGIMRLAVLILFEVGRSSAMAVE